MKEQLTTEITRQMLPYLDNAQMEQLQEVLSHCFWVCRSLLTRMQYSIRKKKQMQNCWKCLFRRSVWRVAAKKH